MQSKFWKLILVVAAASALFALGCSDDNDDNGNNTPPPRAVGVWDSDQATLTYLGLTDFTYYFYTDYTYRYVIRNDTIPAANLDESGTWTLAGALNDSIAFHATLRDSAVINENYTWRYDIVEGATQASDVFHLWYFVDPGYYEAVFPRTQ
jgi:hypothetical protein